jgi:hypothetical protein
MVAHAGMHRRQRNAGTATGIIAAYHAPIRILNMNK